MGPHHHGKRSGRLHSQQFPLVAGGNETDTPSNLDPPPYATADGNPSRSGNRNQASPTSDRDSTNRPHGAGEDRSAIYGCPPVFSYAHCHPFSQGTDPHSQPHKLTDRNENGCSEPHAYPHSRTVHDAYTQRNANRQSYPNDAGTSRECNGASSAHGNGGTRSGRTPRRSPEGPRTGS